MTKLDLVCVIDDDLIYSIAVKHIINRSAISENIIFFKNGQAALEFFEENVNNSDLLPDLILLDLNMPILDGWQFLAKYEPLTRNIEKKIPVYIVSSSIDDEEYEKAKLFETVKDFIIKPITIARLHEIVEALK